MNEKRQERFTPGPWERAVATAGHAWIFGNNRNFIVGEVQGLADGEGRANSALISAAPEMYDCVCDALTDLQMSDAMRVHFEAVLRKARGEE